MDKTLYEMYFILKDVVLFSIEPPNDFFYIEKYSGRIYLRRSPSENPSVSEYTVSFPNMLSTLHYLCCSYNMSKWFCCWFCL